MTPFGGPSRGRLLRASVDRPVVLEITEHTEIDDYPGLRRELERLGASVRVAVDDAGAGFASFRHILELAPDFVKIDLDLVRGVDAEPARQALIAGMGYFAVKRKLRLIAEGIETRRSSMPSRRSPCRTARATCWVDRSTGRRPRPGPQRSTSRPFRRSDG